VNIILLLENCVCHRCQQLAGGEKGHCGRFCEKNSKKIAALLKIFDWHRSLELLQLIQPGDLSAQDETGEGSVMVTAVGFFMRIWI